QALGRVEQRLAVAHDPHAVQRQFVLERVRGLLVAGRVLRDLAAANAHVHGDVPQFDELQIQVELWDPDRLAVRGRDRVLAPDGLDRGLRALELDGVRGVLARGAPARRVRAAHARQLHALDLVPVRDRGQAVVADAAQLRDRGRPRVHGAIDTYMIGHGALLLGGLDLERGVEI